MILFVPACGRGSNGIRARRAIVVCATDPYAALFPSAIGPGGDFSDTGTAGPVTLQGGGAGRLFLNYTLPSSPHGDLEHGAAAFYIVDLAARARIPNARETPETQARFETVKRGYAGESRRGLLLCIDREGHMTRMRSGLIASASKQ